MYQCQRSSCMNGGKCIVEPSMQAFICKCRWEYTGTRCQSRTWWSLELGATKENPESASTDIPWSLIIYLCVFILIIGIASFIIWRFLLWRRIELYKLNSVRNSRIESTLLTPARNIQNPESQISDSNHESIVASLIWKTET